MEVHWRNGQIIKTRKREHIENVKKCKVGSNIAKHAWENNHAIDFANCKVIDRENFRHRGTWKSWHTAITINADNNAKHLPEQYRFLLQ